MVDASGAHAARKPAQGADRDKVFDQFAIHNGSTTTTNEWNKKPSMKDFIFIHFLPIPTVDLQIPITDTITSIGVVTREELRKDARVARRVFRGVCGSRPEISTGFAPRTRSAVREEATTAKRCSR